MCGIVGYIGKGDAKTVVLQGLEKLEYRGYDSAGIAVITDGEIKVEKKKGRLKVLEDYIANMKLDSHIGIGHTRWATHGAPSDRNSHPHYTEDKSIVLVHNGIIENYASLKEELQKKGYKFSSDTDTEVVAHLIHSLYQGDIFKAVTEAVKRLRGSYALGIIHKDFPNQLICARKDSPLVIGVGEEENIIASDIPAVLKYTKKVIFLEDNDIAIITKDSIRVYDKELKETQRELKTIEWDYEQATKGGYPHFMIKEIFEQPKSILETIERRVKNKKIDFSDVLTEDDIKNCKMIHIVACGTAYHAGLQGQHALREIARTNSFAQIASEYRYTNPFVDKGTIAIFVSQSGETLDTIAALKEAKSKGAKTIAITNVVGSTISREADETIYTMAGPEIAVASTKAYTTQVAIFHMLSLYIAEKKGLISKEKYDEFLKALYHIPEQVKKELEEAPKIEKLAEQFREVKDVFFIGRTLDYAIAQEASLKMKEISYIHTETFPAGELKHGSIALIEEGTSVVVVGTQHNILEKTVSNVKELKARGARVLSVGIDSNELKEVSDEFLEVSKTEDVFAGLLAIIPLQLLAYYTSVARGIDVDKPRNLAKSVTVE